MNFKDFFTKSGTKGIISVAHAYAYGGHTVTFKGIDDEFQITENTVKSCIKYAIINCICSYQTALLIKNKAHSKQINHMKNFSERTPSDKYYDEILCQRFEFVNNIRDSEILEIVTYFLANHNHLSIDEIANTTGYSEKELKIILSNAIRYNLVDNKTATKIKATSFMQF